MTDEKPRLRWFYWFQIVFTATQVVWAGIVLFDFFTHPFAPDPAYGSPAFRLISMLGIVPLVLIVSLLVIRRAPRNVTGLFLVQWATLIIGTSLRPDSPLSRYSFLSAGWVGLWLLPLYFPDGRAFPRRFERVVEALSAFMVLCVLGWTLFQPTLTITDSSQSQMLEVANPVFIPALQGLAGAADVVEGAAIFSTVLLILPSILLRYRRSDERTRLQMRWLGWVFVVILITTIPVFITGITIRPIGMLQPYERILLYCWDMLITLGPHLAVGIAILRHRLYDIDIIIRRTVTYSMITGLLAAVYFGAVTLLQSVFSGLIGSQSPLAVVISTLGIAALFTPLRRRVQNFVDRRFNRSKYNAEKTLEAFAEAMRDDVELDHLSAALVGVVEDTMQPESIGLWLNESQAP